MTVILSAEAYITHLLDTPRPGEENILAFYEHRLGVICKAPRLMLLPLDDHLAHRGDGVFETIKYINGRLYQLDEHIDRMRSSAEGIYLEPPCSWEELRELVLEVASAGELNMGMMRLLLGRGPGGFSLDPYESPKASLYIVAYRFELKPESWYRNGLKGFRTTIPAKQGYLARIKNANYLPNVLMIREGHSRGMDVPFCFSEDGFLAESAAANICIVNHEGELEVPVFTNALPGTTVRRALDLLEGKVPHIMRRINEQDVRQADEVLMLGTGPDCAAITEYEGEPIGDGTEGSVASMLRELIRKDILAVGVPIPGIS